MTAFAWTTVTFSVFAAINILLLHAEVRRLKRNAAAAVPARPAISGTARFSRQTKNGVIDIDLHS